MREPEVKERMKTTEFIVDQDPDKYMVCEFAGGVAGVYSKRCPGKTEPNEDAALLITLGPATGILAVADGFGGQPSGEEAARLSVKAIQESVQAPDITPDRVREAILRGFEKANEATKALGVGAASTLAVAEINTDQIRTYHAGDSMILLTGRRGKLKFQNISHSPVGYALKAGFLEEQEAMEHEDRHLVSNMIGSEEMHIELGPSLAMSSFDTLLVASDGITDNLLLDEIINTIRKGAIEKTMASLARTTASRMDEPVENLPSKPDDATFIVFRRKPPPRSKGASQKKQ